jgi:outer membrane protein OmpA-like peptidoglycan-associated protein
MDISSYFFSMRAILLIIISLGLSTSLFAQSVEFSSLNFPDDASALKRAVANLEKGRALIERGPKYFERGLVHLLDAHQFNGKNATLNFEIGTIYNRLKMIDSASVFMERAMKLDSKYRTDGLFLLAKMFHLEGKWDDAIKKYREYITLISADADLYSMRQRGQIEAEIIEINRRIIQCENGREITRDTVPVMITNLGKKLNTRYPEYAAVVNKDETFMVFTSRRPGNTGGKIPNGEVFQYEDIYFTQRDKNGTWTTARRLDGVNTKAHDASVWLSQDAQTLIIYREKRNGDLYMATSEGEGGSFSKPKPMRMLNSKYREAHASMTADGKTIYFTSNNPALGTNSLDIYKVSKDSVSGKWSKPVNMGGAINSEYDEECVFISPDGKTMYFSSAGHNTMGGMDIFKTVFEEGQWTTPENLGFPINTPADDVFIFFSGDGDHAYMDSDRLGGKGEKDVYLMEMMEGKTVPYYFVVLDSITGKTLEVQMQVVSAKDQEEFRIYEQPDNLMTVLPVFGHFYVKATRLGYKSHIGVINTRFNSMDERNFRDTIYMSLGDDVITLSGTIYDALTNEEVNGKIEISSEDHFASLIKADKRGRFKTVVSPEQLYTIKVTADGYETVVEKTKFEVDPNISEYLKDFYLGKLDFDKDYRLNNIYFDFNRATLRELSIRELKNLKFLLDKYPNLRVEVSAHTDNVGSHAYNIVLSQRRAESVVNWLVLNGLNKARLVPKGYAYDKPAAPNDTPENRQLNRRVEFKFLRN